MHLRGMRRNTADGKGAVADVAERSYLFSMLEMLFADDFLQPCSRFLRSKNDLSNCCHSLPYHVPVLPQTSFSNVCRRSVSNSFALEVRLGQKSLGTGGV